MEAQAIMNADYLDILFYNRNKQYGGYAIRKYDDRRKIRALLLVLFFCSTALAVSLMPEKQVLIEQPTHKGPYTPTDPDKLIRKPPPPVQPETRTPPPAERPTIQNALPVISPDEAVTNVPPPVDSFAGRESGPVTAAGEPGGTDIAPASATGGTGTAVVAPPAEPIVLAEVMPEFIGNIYKYLSESVRYPQTAIQAGIQGRVLVQFVVNEDGRISRVKLMRGIGGGCDEEAMRVVSVMPDWKPGKQNGRPVKVFFTLPIAFRLE